MARKKPEMREVYPNLFLGKLVCIDSEFAHIETVEPVIKVLQEPWHAGANDEFLHALDHYRHGGDEYGDCLSECAKAFESTMKAIYDKRNWVYDPVRNDASKLIAICMDIRITSHETCRGKGCEVKNGGEGGIRTPEPLS